MPQDILKSVSDKSGDEEFYSSIPEGYVKGKTKFIVVCGSVMSGVGKGIFSASLANLLKQYGLKISPIKFDGYLNYDAGTLNPFRHGEVFVLDDGTECDLDLGTYERFLEQNLSKRNYLTAGKIFKNIIDKERAGEFLGRDVQFIPHVTGEIKRYLRELAMSSNADVVQVEVGGTAGDLENSYFLEAMRELAYEEGRENMCFVNVTYIMKPPSLGEHKSKAAQLGIRTLMSLGIQSDIIVCRSEDPINNNVRNKISIAANVPVSRVINSTNTNSIYNIPIYLNEIKVDDAVFDVLNIEKKELSNEFDKWKEFVNKGKGMDKKITIGITGKYTNIHDSYLSILKALEHCSYNLGVGVDIKWIETTEIEQNGLNPSEVLKGIDGIIVPGGFGKRGTEGKIECIKYARENNIPFLGLCYAFQMAVVDFARNVCGLEKANSTEIDHETNEPVVDILPEQKKIEGLGGTMRLGGHDVEIKEGTIAHKLYNNSMVRERFRHRYECNPDYIEILEKNGMMFSGKAPNHPIMQILELPKHKFFIATQFHPEFSSRPLNPHPLFKGFVESCL